ncbi:MAG: RidA family protein [Hyphomicrobiaceae bacterium]
MSHVTYLNPPSAGPVQGLYSHVARVKPGELAFIAGQVGIDRSGQVPADVGAQVNAVFDALGRILKDLGGDFSNVVRFTTYLTGADDIAPFMAARKELFPTLFKDGKYPPNTLLIVDRLVKPEFKVEIEAIAALPA